MAVDGRAIAKQLASMGMGEDNELLHVRKDQIPAIAKALGHAGKINPRTGKRGFDEGDQPGGTNSDTNESSGTGGTGTTGQSSAGQSGPGPSGDPNAGSVNSEDALSSLSFDALTATPATLGSYATTIGEVHGFNSGFFGTIADFFGLNAIADYDKSAQQFGLGLSFDFNPVGMVAGLIGGPVVGVLAGKAASAMGIPNASITVSQVNGLNVTANEPGKGNPAAIGVENTIGSQVSSAINGAVNSVANAALGTVGLTTNDLSLSGALSSPGGKGPAQAVSHTGAIGPTVGLGPPGSTGPEAATGDQRSEKSVDSTPRQGAIGDGSLTTPTRNPQEALAEMLSINPGTGTFNFAQQPQFRVLDNHFERDNLATIIGQRVREQMAGAGSPQPVRS